MDWRASRMYSPRACASGRTPIAATGRGELRIVGHRVELQGDADETLQQRVVQFAAQPRALAETSANSRRTRRLAAARCADGRERGTDAQRVEPDRLIERRLDRERELGPATGPDSPSALASPETVAARRQIRVERLAARAGVHPVTVEPFELVAEPLPQRRGEIDRRELHLEPRDARPGACRCRPESSGCRRQRSPRCGRAL